MENKKLTIQEKLKNYTQVNLLVLLLSPIGAVMIVTEMIPTVKTQYLIGTMIFYAGCIIAIVLEEKNKRIIDNLEKEVTTLKRIIQ